MNPCRVLRTGMEIKHPKHGDGRIHYLVGHNNNWVFALAVNKINHIKVYFKNESKIIDVFPNDIELKEK